MIWKPFLLEIILRRQFLRVKVLTAVKKLRPNPSPHPKKAAFTNPFQI